MDQWPALPYEEWRATRDTLHMYTQVLGKLRLALSPFEPEWANVPLYLTARGLTTSRIPVGLRSVDAELDLLGHELIIRSSDGKVERRPLGGDVATFYRDFLRMLARMDIEVAISEMPSEVADPIPFPADRTHDTYTQEDAAQFFRVLSIVEILLRDFRARFRGRTSPVQFFWGTFDLALLRFSGRPLDPPKDQGVIRRYSADAEAICAGWWPGDWRVRYPAFYAYGYPAPAGIEAAAVRPSEAAWNPDAGEFFLPYDRVRTKSDPARAVTEFLDSTYEAAAGLMSWDPALTKIEAPPPAGGLVKHEEVSR